MKSSSKSSLKRTNNTIVFRIDPTDLMRMKTLIVKDFVMPEEWADEPGFVCGVLGDTIALSAWAQAQHKLGDLGKIEKTILDIENNQIVVTFHLAQSASS